MQKIKKREIKKLLKWVCEFGNQLVESGNLHLNKMPVFSFSGILLDQVFDIVNGEDIKQTWSRYQDYLVQIEYSESILNVRSFLKQLFFNFKTQFHSILPNVSEKYNIPYFTLFDFVEEYLIERNALDFDEILFEKKYLIFKDKIKHIKEETYVISIPTINLLSTKKSLTKNNFSFRLCQINKGEFPIYFIHDFNVNDSWDLSFLQPRFLVDGIGLFVGAFAAYLFETSFTVHPSEELEFALDQFKLIKDKDENNYRQRYNDFLQKKSKNGNTYAQYLLAEKRIRENFYFALKIFKKGDFDIFVIHSGTRRGIRSELTQPHIRIRKEELPDYSNPYILDDASLEKFFTFWFKFQNISDSSQPIFHNALRRYCQTFKNKKSIDILFDLYLSLEILLSSDFNRSSGKAIAIENRVVWLFEQFCIDYVSCREILVSLRNIRNEIAHTGTISDSNIIYLTNLFKDVQIKASTEINYLEESQEFVRIIFNSFWQLLEQNKLNQEAVLQIIHQIR